ncbi:MAG: DUF885 domain-containing protein [Blastocatellia bacterium]|nr:DUF885 domain-containing protein [Blastocatellia bacterium]MCS7157734.1 DUF885 domain-containing protein [Blastocatellia bacterium]MCX7751999.1 DUF885 domain-containing protein [Blastocatellia bacterium]MDW8167105.1 DUF885 domain-containing protein [Acidobacteriota bacterium]MDW8257209.1 DUF885 domain-containing protein [Acidobacteriota bacterium]
MPRQGTRAFEHLVEEFLSGYFAFNPTHATALGVHEYDDQVEDRSAEAIAKEIRRLESSRERMDREVAPEELPAEARLDLKILRSKIEAQLVHLREIRWWARDPGYFSDLAAWSIYSLLVRPTTPLPQRLEAIERRLRAIPRLLAQAQEHLARTAEEAREAPAQGIPRIFVEIALEEFGGACEFFATAVPGFIAEVSDPEKARSLEQANAEVLHACERMRRFLAEELLDGAQGEFALGREVFARLLAAEEHVFTPIEEILQRGWQELRATQQQMQEIARRIAPHRSLPDLLRQLSEDHPTADDLIPSYRRRCEEAKRFVLERELISIPEGDWLEITETPPFYRSLIFAALDPPGPFETAQHPTFFYVTPVDATHPPDRQDAYLRAHNVYAQVSTIIHEAYPGHHVQSLHVRRCPSLVRKVFAAGTFVEGWAHYCEEMMLDEGFGREDPRLRLFQLHEALWRIGRLITATLMHMGQLSLSQAIQFLVQECYQEPENARREVWRYTRDPLVLVYSWGKWQIRALREVYRHARGDAFSLREFHDRLLGYGEPPVSALETMILNGMRGGL